MEDRERMEKSLLDLIEIIHFIEKVPTKIHSKKNEAEIYGTVKEEFRKSKRYDASILLLTDDRTKLSIAETSLTPRKLKAGEKASGLRLKGRKIDLNKSSIYSQVIMEGKNVQANANDIIGEWVPRPLVQLISKIIGYENKPAILTPLKKYGKIIGILAISSTSLAEHFIPSVKNLAEHISNALELADEQIVRKQAEEELREKNMQLQTLIQAIPEIVYFKDAQGRNLVVNRAFEKLVNLNQAEILGKTDEQLLPPDLAEYCRKSDQEVMRSGKLLRIEEQTTGEGGKKLFFDTMKAPIYDDQGNVVGIVGVSRDITEHKKAEEALEEREQNLRSIIDTSPDAIVWTDVTGKITLVNKKVSEITGFSEKDFIGKNFMDIEALTQESKEKILENFIKRIEGIDTLPYEVEVVAKNGEVIPAELSASPIREGGKIVGTQSIFRDLRERKKMEEKLKEYSEHLEELVQKRTEELLESEKRYSILVEEARDGVAIIQDVKFVFTNNRLAEIVGYSRDELIGMPFLKLADEKYRQLLKKRYERRLRGEEIPATYEAAAIAKDGERVPIELSATCIDYQGRSADLVIVRDIRERKRMEEERLKLERLAAIGEVATMVGHDLRNPLQSIENAAYYLNNELLHLPIPTKTMEMLQVISDSVNYADKIIRDLNDFSSTKKPTFQKTNINTIVKEIMSLVEVPENVKLVTKLGHLPELKVDKEMTKRVFLNLAVNAMQAMENGGTLKVSTKKTKEFVEVSFKDTGVGIPKENTKKLFTPFFTTKSIGMGMGLAICKRFVESHGGSIKVDSEEGKGSTFTAKLLI